MRKQLNLLKTKPKTIKNVNKIPKRKNDGSNNKRNVISKTNSVTEIQVSDSNHSTDIEASMTWQLHKTVIYMTQMRLND